MPMSLRELGVRREGDWTEAAACIMGGISARPSACYSGVMLDSDLGVTREAAS